MIGYLPYTPIAHGITGNHGRQLSLPQLIAHSLAMALAGSVVVIAQLRVLKPYINVRWWRVPVAVVAFIAAFWLGYYQKLVPPYPFDIDLLLGFTALGCLVWLGSFRVGARKSVSVLWAVFAFTIGCAVGQFMAFLLLFVGLRIDPGMVRSNMLVHASYFMTVATLTGVVGGALSGRFLAKALPMEDQRCTLRRAAWR